MRMSKETIHKSILRYATVRTVFHEKEFSTSVTLRTELSESFKWTMPYCPSLAVGDKVEMIVDIRLR